MGERDRETDRKKRVCVAPWWKSNAVINGFIESKKLTLSKKKCSRIHISKKNGKDKECPVLKVHEELMKDSVREKYLGDIIHSRGRIQPTIEDRRDKGFAIVAEILTANRFIVISPSLAIAYSVCFLIFWPLKYKDWGENVNWGCFAQSHLILI